MNTDKATPELFAAMARNGSYFLGSAEYPECAVTPEGDVFSFHSMRFLKPMKCGKYLAVGVRFKDGTMVRRYVHRLVAEITHGHIPAGLEVCHNDGNPLNNHEDNLRWDTRANNHADKRRHGTDGCGASNPMAKLTTHLVDAIRARAASGEKQSHIAASIGVSPMTVSRVVRRESWRNK